MSEPHQAPRRLRTQSGNAAIYDRDYYAKQFGPIPYQRNSHWLNFFRGIAEEVIRSLRPKRVFDAGCAWGFLVEAFCDRGVDAWGIDISQYAIRNVRPDMHIRCTVGCVTEPIRNGAFDLVTCIEVLEHLPEQDARRALAQMVLVTDTVLFSSTPDDFDEPTHINVHNAIYWLQLFAEHGFYPDARFDASFIAPHAFLVRRRSDPPPEEMTLLFSEVLSGRAARVAFLTRHNRIVELERQIDQLQSDAAARSREYFELVSKNGELKGLTDALSQEREYWLHQVQPLHRERDRLKNSEAELTAARGQLAELGHNLAVVREQNQELIGTVVDLLKEREHWRYQAQALLQERDQLKNSEAELTAARGQLAELGHNLVAIREQNQELISTVVDLLNERQRWEKRGGELQCELALFRQRLEEASLNASRAQAAVEESIAHRTELSVHLEQLSARHAALQTDLGVLRVSPGWNLILRYRAWLHRNWPRHPKAMAVWESCLLWAFRRLQVPASGGERGLRPSHPATPPPLLPAPSAHPDAQAQPDYASWIRENEPDEVQLAIQRQMSGCFSFQPKISVLVPVYKVPLAVLKETIESVLNQTYANWELCVAIVAADNRGGLEYLKQAAEEDPRIRLTVLRVNEGISGNSNRALSLATGEYLALLDHDDTLAPFALFEVVQLLNHDREACFIYSDKDQITEDGQHRLNPLFKPVWSPEIMFNANYLTHLCVMRTDQVRELGGWCTSTDGAQDWDLFLRLTARYGNVRHIPKILYHWRQIVTSVAAKGFEAKPYAAEAQVRSVAAYCGASGLRAEVRQQDGTLRLAWPKSREKVSIIFLSRLPDEQTIAHAMALDAKTDHQSFEILIVINKSSASVTGVGSIRYVEVQPEATLSQRIHTAVGAASGELLVLFDDALTPVEPDWLNEMIGPLQLPHIGIVGAKLLDATTRGLRHCGIVFTPDGKFEYIYRGRPENIFAEAGGANWYRIWSAVSGACIAVRKTLWNTVAGFSNGTLHPRFDLDFCLKVGQQTDYRILYNPYARFLQYHDSIFESSQRVESASFKEYVRACFPHGDPYFSPNLECVNGVIGFKTAKKAASQQALDYGAESRALVTIYDFTREQLHHSACSVNTPATGVLESITWFLPEFSNPFYGGIHTLLRFADGFRRAHGVRSQFCILGYSPERRIRDAVGTAFPELSAASDFFVRHSHTDVDTLPATDAAICSLWTTAFAALRFNRARRKFYFIQDDEALFYPAGSTSALVEATYGFGFHGICNTASLLHSYASRGGQGEHFEPRIDPSVFHSMQRKPIDGAKPYTLFWYARPGHPRNCFELLATALRTLKQRMGDQLLVLTAGADWDTTTYGLEGVVRNLGLLNYESTGALYRICDAGVVMMMTRHPSYLPMELMACGSLVITNRNPETIWLLKDNENCLLSDPSPAGLADRIEEGLRDLNLRRRVTANAAELVRKRFSGWEGQIEKMHAYLRRLC